MSRFGNLEFNRREDLTPEQQPLARNESYFVAEANLAFQNGRFEQALRCFSKILEFNPGNSLAWGGQVRMLIELGEFEEARVWADQGLAHFPEDGELLAAKGVALARLGDLNGALAYSDAAVEIRANTPYIWLARADVLLARREKRAQFCFQKAFDLGRNHWFLFWLASRIEAFYKNFARGLKLAQEALSLESTRASLWVQVARCQAAVGLASQAHLSLAQARQLEPDFPVESLLENQREGSFLDKVAARWRQWFRK